MNLTIALLVARHYVTKARLRQTVEEYRDSTDEAFEKMFERDKDELRELDRDPELAQFVLVTLEHLLERLVGTVAIFLDGLAQPGLRHVVPGDQQRDGQVHQPFGLPPGHGVTLPQA